MTCWRGQECLVHASGEKNLRNFGHCVSERTWPRAGCLLDIVASSYEETQERGSWKPPKRPQSCGAVGPGVEPVTAHWN